MSGLDFEKLVTRNARSPFTRPGTVAPAVGADIAVTVVKVDPAPTIPSIGDEYAYEATHHGVSLLYAELYIPDGVTIDQFPIDPNGNTYGTLALDDNPGESYTIHSVRGQGQVIHLDLVPVRG